MYGNPRYSRWILDSTPWIQESSAGIRIPCQLTLDFAFLELYSGFQCPGFRIPHVRKNFFGFRNPWGHVLKVNVCYVRHCTTRKDFVKGIFEQLIRGRLMRNLCFFSHF